MIKARFCSLFKKSTLKEYLMEYYLVSRSSLKKSKLSKNYLLKAVGEQDQWEVPFDLLNKKEISPNYQGLPVKILKETSGFLAVAKPPLVHTHPLSYQDTNNVLSWCRSQGCYPPLRINTNTYDRGLLYRLDYSTSGALILAKDKSLHAWIRKNYSSACKQKIYLALINGIIKDAHYEHYLDTSAKKVKKSASGKKSNIEIELLYTNHRYSLIRINLKQGLRHQIRAQLGILGHPIVGDTVYGGEQAPRVFLHAYQYEIHAPSQKISVCDNHLDSFSMFLNLNSIFKVLKH